MAPGEHQPAGVGPHTAPHTQHHLCPCCPWFPGANLLLEKQANGDLEWGSRDTPVGWGSGKPGQPLHPLLKGHSSTGAKPLTSTDTTSFLQRRNEASAKPQALHGCSPLMEHPVSHAALQAQNRFPVPEQKEMWADPSVSPSSPPREAQETSEILSVQFCQQKQFCGFPTGSQGCSQKEAAVPEVRGETPTWLQNPHTPPPHGAGV